MPDQALAQTHVMIEVTLKKSQCRKGIYRSQHRVLHEWQQRCIFRHVVKFGSQIDAQVRPLFC